MNETDDPNSTACHRGKVCCSGKAMGRAKAQQERPDAPPKQKVASAMARVPRRDGTYQPQGQEEYLTDAIQQQKYLDILLPTTDIEDSSEILSRDGVIFVENAIPIDLIDAFMQNIQSFSRNHDSLVGLEGLCEIFEGPDESLSAINWKKLSKDKVLKSLKECIDSTATSLIGACKPVPNEIVYAKEKTFQLKSIATSFITRLTWLKALSLSYKHL